MDWKLNCAFFKTVNELNNGEVYMGPKVKDNYPAKKLKKMTRAEVQRRLEELYTQFAPEKLHLVPTYMKEWRGKEMKLLESVEKKYNPPVNDYVTNPLREDDVASTKKKTPIGFVGMAKAGGAKRKEVKAESPNPPIIAYSRAKIQALLEDIYAEHNPVKVSSIPKLMREWRGKEMQLLESVRSKYGVSADEEGDGDNGGDNGDGEGDGGGDGDGGENDNDNNDDDADRGDGGSVQRKAAYKPTNSHVLATVEMIEKKHTLQPAAVETCYQCNSIIQPNAKFCMSCGAAQHVSLNCEGCGNNKMTRADKFCNECGTANPNHKE